MTAQSCGPVAGVAFRAAALALACLLLGNQILMAWEITDGAPLSARSGAISAMIAVALLPICVEYARRLKSFGLAIGLFVVTALFLAYSAPTTFSRMSAPREKASLATQEYAQAKIDKAKANEALEACKAQRKACGTAERDVDRKNADVESARSRLVAGQTYVAGWDTLAYVAAVELGVALLFALAFRRRAPAGNEQESTKMQSSNEQAPSRTQRMSAAVWISGYLDTQSQPVSSEEAYATYLAEWEKRATRTTGQDKFTELFQKEARRRGLAIQQVGRRRLYAVA